MYDRLLKKRNLIIAVIIFVAIIILFLPVNIPFKITATGKVVAGQGWLLVRQTDGSLMATLRDNVSHATESYMAFQMERGDVYQFGMKSGLKNMNSIVTGDTAGYLFSNELFRDLKRLEGRLEIAKSYLDVVSTGERETIIREAQDQFLLNRERSLVQNEILERQTKLYQDALISREDFEVTRGMTRIYKLEMQVAESHLKTLQAGEKPEIIKEADSQIAAIEAELAALESHLSLYALVTPMTGKIYSTFSHDTLLMVLDDQRVVVMPIPWQFFNEVDTTNGFTAGVLYNEDILQGTIHIKSNFMRMIGGQQVFFVSGILEQKDPDLPVNMLVKCTISGINRTPFDYLIYFIEALI